MTIQEVNLDETYYRKYLYPKRLGWTNKFIPVRLFKYGLYIECLVHTIGNKNDMAMVKVAYLPVNRETTELTNIQYLYPSKRILYRTSEDGSKLEEYHLNDDDSFEPEHRTIDFNMLKKIYMYIPNMSFTSPEIASFVNCSVTEADRFLKKTKFAELKGIKHCLIMGRDLPSWKIIMPVEEKISITKKENIIDLRDEYSNCSKCSLGESRIARKANFVFGRGCPDALGMIIAEAPGRIEEQTKFVLNPEAPAGNILYRVMNKVGLDQSAWFLTNAVVCRPLPPETSSSENGKPNNDQITACNTRLKRVVRSVSPRLIVLCGTTAYKAFFNKEPENGISNNLGWQTIFDQNGNIVNYEIFVTYHPSYIARASSLSPEENLKIQKLYLSHFEEIYKRYKEIEKEYEK